MTLHPALRAELLDDELGVARARLGIRVTGIERRDALIRIPLFAADGGLVFLTLDGGNYDAEPFGLYVTESDGAVAPPRPGGLGNSPRRCIRYSTDRSCASGAATSTTPTQATIRTAGTPYA